MVRLLIIAGVLGVVHALLYAPQGTLYAQARPGALPLHGDLVRLPVRRHLRPGPDTADHHRAPSRGGGSPWSACGYLVLTGLIGLTATVALRPADPEPTTSD